MISYIMKCCSRTSYVSSNSLLKSTSGSRHLSLELTRLVVLFVNNSVRVGGGLLP